MFIPGSIFPAADSFQKLILILKDQIEFILKDHDIYAVDTPPTTWRLGTEVDGLGRFADSMGFDAFHIVGYSFGGSLALAFASKYIERLQSITLIEPDWIGNVRISQEELQYREELKMIFRTPPEKFINDFMRMKVQSNIEIPSLDENYDLQKRAVGVRAFLRSFDMAELLYGRFSTFKGPVYVALGAQSRLIEMAKARRIESAFANCSVNVYDDCHHWTPPQVSQPEKFAAAMLKLWSVNDS